MILRRAHEMTGGGDLNPVVRQLDTGNAILNVKTQVADYALDAERLAVLCAWNGRQKSRSTVDESSSTMTPG